MPGYRIQVIQDAGIYTWGQDARMQVIQDAGQDAGNTGCTDSGLRFPEEGGERGERREEREERGERGVDSWCLIEERRITSPSRFTSPSRMDP
jgi:hypothetical protein